MRDEYVGDIGDFGKYGLLRWLCCPHGQGDNAISLGINWYYTSHGVKSASSQRMFVYLRSPFYEDYDAQLYDLLNGLRFKNNTFTSMVALSAIEGSEALPSTTLYYATPVPRFGGDRQQTSDRNKYDISRTTWHQDALAKLSKASMVFLDPDDGIPKDSPYAGRHLKVLREELRDYIDNFDTVISYQHFNHLNRVARVKLMFDSMNAAYDDVAGLHLAGVSFKNDTGSAKPTRLYYVFYKDHNIEQRIRAMNASKWGELFSMIE